MDCGEGRGKEGIEEGKAESQLEIAKNLLDVLNDETIALKTGFSVEEVSQLRQKGYINL